MENLKRPNYVPDLMRHQSPSTLPATLLARIDAEAGCIEGGVRTERRLSDLQGYFADAAAYEAALAEHDSIVYTVSTATPAEGSGQLGYGLGVLRPGRIGAEYHLTKGHLHTWREAAELYLGLRGKGGMLLEDETTGEARWVPLTPNAAVYVPGHTAHRTVNTGGEPLVYLGIYPAEAGHDYAFIAERNFCNVVVERDGAPTLVERAAYLRSL